MTMSGQKYARSRTDRTSDADCITSALACGLAEPSVWLGVCVWRVCGHFYRDCPLADEMCEHMFDALG